MITLAWVVGYAGLVFALWQCRRHIRQSHERFKRLADLADGAIAERDRARVETALVRQDFSRLHLLLLSLQRPRDRPPDRLEPDEIGHPAASDRPEDPL